MRYLGPYYYGQHRWDNYLLDIQESIQLGTKKHAEETRVQTAELGRQTSALREICSDVEALRERWLKSRDCVLSGFCPRFA